VVEPLARQSSSRRLLPKTIVALRLLIFEERQETPTCGRLGFNLNINTGSNCVPHSLPIQVVLTTEEGFCCDYRRDNSKINTDLHKTATDKKNFESARSIKLLNDILVGRQLSFVGSNISFELKPITSSWLATHRPNRC